MNQIKSLIEVRGLIQGNESSNQNDEMTVPWGKWQPKLAAQTYMPLHKAAGSFN